MRSFSFTSKGMYTAATDCVMVSRWLLSRCEPQIALTRAARMKRSDIMLFLLDSNRVSATAKNEEGCLSRTPLQLAAYFGLLDVAEYLWSKAEVRSNVNDAANALYDAVSTYSASDAEQAACVRLLLAPPSPLHANSVGSSALSHLQTAVTRRSVEVVEVLLEALGGLWGNDVGDGDDTCWNALHTACACGDNDDDACTEVVRILLNAPDAMEEIDALDH